MKLLPTTVIALGLAMILAASLHDVAFGMGVFLFVQAGVLAIRIALFVTAQVQQAQAVRQRIAYRTR